MIDSKMVAKFDEIIKEAVSLGVAEISINNNNKFSTILFDNKEIETLCQNSLCEAIFEILKTNKNEKINFEIEQFGRVHYYVNDIVKIITYKSTPETNNNFKVTLKLLPSLVHRKRPS